MITVSICIPTYNGGRYLLEALHSVEAQSFRDFEVIISDNTSDDKTLTIAKTWAQQQTFPVHIYENHEKGIGKNWNFCIKKSSGKYIKFLLQDDTLEKNCLQTFVDALSYKNHTHDVILCQRNIIGENTTYTREWESNNSNLQVGFQPDENGNYIIGREFLKTPSFYERCVNKFGEPTALFIKKDVFDKIGLYNEHMKQLLDLELYHRYLKIGKILILKEKLVNFRLHENQATYQNLSHSDSERERYIRYTIPKNYFFFLPWKKIIKQQITKCFR